MPLLRITQTREAEQSYQVEISLEKDGRRVQTGRARFDFEMSRDEQEDLRWYFEDYLVFSGIEPAPTIAARIEGQLQEIGRRLFEDVFRANNVTRKIWGKIAEELSDSRVEIAVDVSEGTEVPWELVFDPDTSEYVALQAGTFVRTHCGAVRAVRVPEVAESLRILLVICRPAKDKLPFRSDAMCILKGLRASDRATFRLDVLRPPTFEEMARSLRRAKAEGQAYHVVHFDGHGTFGDVVGSGVDTNQLLSTPARAGTHGYLVFENPEIEDDVQYVDGPALGRVLVEGDVSVLVLNACRSAYAKPGTEPSRVGQDPHATVRAFGSLAQEVMDQGVPGVVAMRYSVYVMTGAQFLVDMYGELARAGTLGGAVTSGRKQLRAKPLREIAYSPCRLDDWSVPVVYEGAPIALLSRPVKDAPLEIKLRGVGEEAAGEGSGLDDALPKRPDVGFYGRDETLLALDRAFDGHRVVLLHAYAGSGKTATSAEFARWYIETGGLDSGAVLFSKFEQYTPLRAVLGHFGALLGASLEGAGFNWGAITETSDMRDVALQVLRQVPVLWIWDNVEPVAGFPKGAESAWSKQEQDELADFLRDARETKAKFLLTSRRDERDWLVDLPRRIRIRAMPMAERVQLARALAGKYGKRLAEVEDWRALLEFTQGNPQTITAVVGQALRDGLKSKEEIEGYVEELRRGEAKFADEETEGRSKSLGASLNYGFEHAFGEDERRQLALLHLFQGFVDVDALKFMGDPEDDWCVAEVRGLTREAGIGLLDRAAEVGLLTAHGGGYYGIHPALPWFFKGLFDRYYAGRAVEARRAFVEAMGWLGNYYHAEYGDGNRDVIGALRAEEANLLHTRRLARANGWWHGVTSAMQGLRTLYGHTGRRGEWKRLVEEIVPDFVAPATDGPLPGREGDWSLVTEYRVILAEEELQWGEAERLQGKRVEWNRKRARTVLKKKPEELDAEERNRIRTLAVSLHELGEIQREIGQADCVGAYQDSLQLSEQIGEGAGAATCAFNLGHAYMDIPKLRDLGKAKECYQRSLDLSDKRDMLDRGKCLSQLGLVAYERFKEAREADRPKEEVLKHLNEAARLYHEALEMTPKDAVGSLAVKHNQLGNIYADGGQLDKALGHYREAIRYREREGHIYEAGKVRFNVGLTLADAGRLTDALEYAKAALRNYESYGQRAADRVQKAKGLIAKIEKDLKKQGGKK